MALSERVRVLPEGVAALVVPKATDELAEPNSRDDIVHPAYPRSWQHQLLALALKSSIKPMLTLTPITATSLRRISQLFLGVELLFKQLPDFVRTHPVHGSTWSAEWQYAGEALDHDRVILYLHGGGYFFGSAAAHRPLTWRLSQATGRPVFSLNYRLAPDHRFEHWLEDAVSAYRHLLDEGYAPERILIAGDSAGGHLTLMTLLALRDSGLPLPTGAVCLSPWTDLGCDGDSYHENDAHDIMLPGHAIKRLARFYLRGLDPRSPQVSPIYADLHGLPPLMVMAGGAEVLRDDARRFAVQAREAGVRVLYEEWHGMPHVFPMFAGFLPEGQLAFHHIARFVRTLG